MLNNLKFIFYDYETFGLHTCLDKPAQFASITTDCNFNVIGSEKIFYCAPPIDYLPNPKSILMTGITPEYVRLVGVNEAIFSQKINQIFTKPNSCILGFNNLNFDDEITRNIFYRNLINPYSWSWENNNSRWDILILLRVCYALRPEILKWAKNSQGIVSLKLKDVTNKNNIKHRNVHSAISDVSATIQVAKLIRKKNSRLFNFLFKYRKKNNILHFIELNKNKPVLYVSNLFGAKRYFVTVIMLINWYVYNKNIYLACDITSNVLDLIQYIKSRSILLLEKKVLLKKGLMFININKCPVLLPMSVLRTQDQIRLGINLSYCFKQFLIFKKNIHVFNVINKKNFFEYNSILINNVDLKIYNNFLNLHDSLILKKLLNVTPEVVSKKSLVFIDNRMNEIFFRYKARNFPNSLNRIERIIWLKHCRKYFNVSYLKTYEALLKENIKIFSKNYQKISLLKQIIFYYKKIISIVFNLK